MTDKKEDALATIQHSVSIPDAANLRAIATDMINSAFFKSVSAVPQAVAIILYGQALGIEPVVALQTIQPVSGRMCVTTTILQALFQRKGGRIKVLERSEERAKVEFRFSDWEPYVHEYTKEDAIAEELWGKDNWKKRRKSMLLYRCISGGLKVYDPGSHLGIITSEEMEDYPGGLPETTVAKPEPEKAPDKAHEAPKPATLTPEASLKAEKPATAPAGTAPVKKQAPPKQAAAPKEGFEAEDEPGDDVADQAEHAESESDEDILVDELKAAIEAEGVDVKAFKEWLFTFQDEEKMRLHPRMVVKLGKSLRFHGAVREDLEYLKAQLNGAIAVFRYATKKEPDKK